MPLAAEVAPVDFFEGGLKIREVDVLRKREGCVFGASLGAFPDLGRAEPVEDHPPGLGMALIAVDPDPIAVVETNEFGLLCSHSGG